MRQEVQAKCTVASYPGYSLKMARQLTQVQTVNFAALELADFRTLHMTVVEFQLPHKYIIVYTRPVVLLVLGTFSFELRGGRARRHFLATIGGSDDIPRARIVDTSYKDCSMDQS